MNLESTAGSLVGLAFAVIGAVNLLALLQTFASRSDLWLTLSQVAVAVFLISFGAAAVRAYMGVPVRYFGFLAFLTGRAIFFLVMSMYVLGTATGCRSSKWWSGRTSCWDRASNLEKLALVAGWAGLAQGFFLTCCLLLRHGGKPKIKHHSSARPMDLLSAVASVGICIVAWHASLDLLAHSQRMDLYVLFEAVSRTVILLIFGVCSLLGAVLGSAFVSVCFGFLDHGWPCGLFYLLMGFWQFPLFQIRRDMLDHVCYGCCIAAMLSGALTLALGGKRYSWF